jgi:starch-binding outer membrane protein, SusD/RagB family
MLPDTEGAMHTARGAGFGAALLIAAALSACNIDRLLNTKDKDTATPGSINSATGLPNARAGAISQFQVAFGGSAAGGGSSNEGQINMTGLLTDEYIDLETFPTRITVDNRIAEAGNGTLRGIFLDMSQARVSTERAAALYQQFDSANVFHAEVLNLAAYSYVLFAEDYCSGVPFDAVNPNGSIIYGQPLTTDSIYGRALTDFAAALKIAIADSAATGDPKGIEQINLARLGTARVLLDRGQFAAASAVAVTVPPSFVYSIEGSTNTPRENNGVWYFTTQLAFSVADVEGINGLNFLSAGDPRVKAVDAGTPGFSGIGPDFQIEQKYTSPTDPIPLATGLEAQLIDAEAKLQAGQIGPWAAELNALRTAFPDTILSKHPLKADSTSAASPALRVDVMFRERAFWLYLTAHRLSDMRRLIRQYGRDPESVFPTGTDAITGAPYGTSVEFPVSSDEFNNPNFHGCLNNNA